MKLVRISTRPLKTLASSYDCILSDFFSTDNPNINIVPWNEIKDYAVFKLNKIANMLSMDSIKIELLCNLSVAYLVGNVLREGLKGDLTSLDITLCGFFSGEMRLLGANQCQIEYPIAEIETLQEGNGSGTILVLEIGKDKKALSSVERYRSEKDRSLNNMSILQVKLDGNIVDGVHLVQICDQIAKKVADRDNIYLFGFCPAPLMFMLGAKWRHMKRVQLYEFIQGNYVASFIIN